MVYEPHDAPKVTWNAAFIAIDSPPTRISSIEQLCDVQPDLSLDSAYWTALKLNSNGSFQWGRVPYISAHLPLPLELLDNTTSLDRCYAISNSAMKLKSMDCSVRLPVVASYIGEVYQSLSIFTWLR